MYETGKSTKNQLSNFGLIKENLELSRFLLAVTKAVTK